MKGKSGCRGISALSLSSSPWQVWHTDIRFEDLLACLYEVNEKKGFLW